jgi:hypothetical protein
MDVEGGEIPILERMLETMDLYSDDIEIIVELSIASDSVEWSKRNRIFMDDIANLLAGRRLW